MNKVFPTLELENGVKMPVMGFGCADFPNMQVLERTVELGLQLGYRFFDNAPFYRDEAEVGAALKASDIPREELFISTKLPNGFHDYEAALARFEESRKAMGVEYFDMYMIHFPCPDQGQYTEAWRALEKLYKDGRVRAIGVSNFKETHLQRIFDACEVKPMINEIECNPYFAQPELRKFCIQNGIRPVAWFPLGGPIGAIEEPEPGTYASDDPIGGILEVLRNTNQGKKVMLRDPVAETIGKRNNKSIVQVILRWHIQSGIIPIPKSADAKYLAENCDVFDFELTNEEMKEMNALDHNRRLGPDPDLADMHNCS
ncbi:MAG: aldo/keto reductase [Oscillospiraceae bacterium]|nr:aldo/keto reductase [Oscillospiraceae bacterium]